MEAPGHSRLRQEERRGRPQSRVFTTRRIERWQPQVVCLRTQTQRRLKRLEGQRPRDEGWMGIGKRENRKRGVGARQPYRWYPSMSGPGGPTCSMTLESGCAYGPHHPPDCMSLAAGGGRIQPRSHLKAQRRRSGWPIKTFFTTSQIASISPDNCSTRMAASKGSDDSHRRGKQGPVSPCAWMVGLPIFSPTTKTFRSEKVPSPNTPILG